MTLSAVAPHALASRRLLPVALLSWLMMLGFDFFLHGGLLAGLYTQDHPFLLAPLDAFKRIPLGYASFLLIAGLMAWLLDRLGLVGWRRGAAFGLAFGGVLWAAQVLALFSITTAPASLLLGWFFGQTAEMAIGGAVAGHGLSSGVSLKRLLLMVLAADLVLVVVTVALQSAGIAPTASP